MTHGHIMIQTRHTFFHLQICDSVTSPSTQVTSRGLFGSVVAVAFQIAFRVKMHVNDVFLFFKNHF